MCVYFFLYFEEVTILKNTKKHKHSAAQGCRLLWQFFSAAHGPGPFGHGRLRYSYRHRASSKVRTGLMTSWLDFFLVHAWEKFTGNSCQLCSPYRRKAFPRARRSFLADALLWSFSLFLFGAWLLNLKRRCQTDGEKSRGWISLIRIENLCEPISACAAFSLGSP